MSEPLEKKSQSPLYMQLMNRLKNDVLAGVYPPGARIPSEQVLCETYGVSRVTVRKAMLDLVQEGLLVRRQGKGTFVADERMQRNLQHVTSFTRACAGHSVSTRLVDARREPATPDDVERLHAPEESQVLEITRLRLCDGEPVMLEVNRFPQNYLYLDQMQLEGSLYDLLRAHGVQPSRGVHDISLGHATPTVGKYLGTPVGEALLVLEETIYDQHDRPLHTSKQWIRGDKFTFRI
ncbi:MAG: GntR family transcriptional regulator [Eubacteriales bacterium]|nr:GntR family transcriptional regulator [Eubacteriales bacterium]